MNYLPEIKQIQTDTYPRCTILFESKNLFWNKDFEIIKKLFSLQKFEIFYIMCYINFI